MENQVNKKSKKNEKNKTMKKIRIIVLIVVLALGVIGVGYAAWSQTLAIGGTANMGSLSAVFDSSNSAGTSVGTAANAAHYTVSGDGSATLMVSLSMKRCRLQPSGMVW